MTKPKPKDVIAITSLVLMAILKLRGFNGHLDTAMALILGYYFAHRFHGDDTGE